MNDRFASHAVILAGHCCRILGWRPGDFWAATPDEVMAILHPPGAAGPISRHEIQTLLERDCHG